MEETENPPKVEEELLECSRCHKMKPREDFYPTTNYWCQKRGCTYYCRDCSRTSAKDSLNKKKSMVPE